MAHDRTSEGYAPDGGLEPNPVGKPDPAKIDPQLTAMVIDRLRDGIGFPPSVKTLDGFIEWVKAVDLGAARLSKGSLLLARLRTELKLAAEYETPAEVFEALRGREVELERLHDFFEMNSFCSCGHTEIDHDPKDHNHPCCDPDCECVAYMLDVQTPYGIPPGQPPYSTQADIVSAVLDELVKGTGLNPDTKTLAGAIAWITEGFEELKRLQQKESNAASTQMYAAVGGESAPFSDKVPITPYGDSTGGGPVSDMLLTLQAQEVQNPDVYHRRDAAAIDDAHTQSFAENPPPSQPSPVMAAELAAADQPHSPPPTLYGIQPGDPPYSMPEGTPAPYLTDPKTAAAEAKAHDDALKPDLDRFCTCGHMESVHGNMHSRSCLAPACGCSSYLLVALQVPRGPTADTPPNLGEFIQEMISTADLDAPSAFDILAVCMELAIFLMGKNKAYGDSALDPVRIMSSSDPAEQLRVRMDDKLSRLMRGHAGGEDALKDLVGYWVLMRVAEKRTGG